MNTIYFLRHQNEGVLTQFPFAQRPTDAQVEVIRAELERRHGQLSARGEPLFLVVVEAALLGPDDVPEIPAPRTAGREGAVADASKPSIKVTAKVG